MLDSSSLGQLKQLKKEIHDLTPRLTGVVKGTRKRFGFIISDEDGQEYLLPQAEMERVLPGDRIQVVLQLSEAKPDKEEKPVAKVEKFIDSSIGSFIGAIKIKNNQYYVLPDHPQMTRWIFIPPKFRKNLNDGDLVCAEICQHPFKNKGRVQASIKAVIGQPDDPFIEHRYAVVKQGIEDKIWQDDELAAIRQTAEQLLENKLGQCKDLRDKPFITIDGASTQDLDDALFIEKQDSGWTLHVAIADVSSFIEPDSALDKIAAKQASSIYLPGQKIPMLPDVLSADICSLKPNQDRLALVCSIDIADNGEIRSANYAEASIRSQGKLSYDAVADFLAGQESELNTVVSEQLKTLWSLAQVRKQWRQTHALIMDEYSDYRFQLDDRGKISNIERQQRNDAQRLVEECMLACNQATAEYLSKHSDNALFLGHNGFKTDQMPGIKKLLASLESDIESESLNALPNYLELQKNLARLSEELPLKEILRKKLNRSAWVDSSQPHFGLGLSCYTTFTSPIRKYSDLLCHRLIKAAVSNERYDIDSVTLQQLNAANQTVRDAQRDCEQSLKCQYLQPFKGKTFTGEISMINHRMIGIYLDEFDLHGQVEVRSLGKGFTFKQDSLQLLSDSQSFKLKQKIDIVIEQVDVRQRQVKLKLAEPANQNVSSHDNAPAS